jgi:ATP-binding protein involved in chromosome partitioning
MTQESPESPEHMGTMPKKVDLKVKHVVLVLSGKGGVGKTTIAVNLAVALATHGYKTGLLDLDIHGPDVPKMLGLEGAKLVGYEKAGIEPVKAGENLTVVSMEFLLDSPSSAVIWRGPMKMGAIRQFLEDVHWGDLDFLVVDLPPGTGDEVLTIAQLAPRISGVVVVTTPQEVSILDITKAVNFAKRLDLPVLGIIENMSGLVCPDCGRQIDLFGSGGGKRAAEELGVPFLGSIPLDPEMSRAGDEGRPYFLASEEKGEPHPAKARLYEIMENLVKVVGEDTKKGDEHGVPGGPKK